MLNTNVAFREPIQKSFRKLSTFYKPSRKERQEYLKSIGLQFDPFRNPVAEQELFPEEEKKDRSPAFFDYFVPPELELPEGKMLLDVLRESKPVFVFGRPGDGKTSLRYNLDADLRNFHDGTLSVPYTLGKDVEGPLSLDEHYARLARNLMIALFIQIVEQFNPINPPPTDDQLSAFRFVLRVGGRSLKRVANRILKGSEPEARYGIGSYWAAIGQTAVRFVNRSPWPVPACSRA
jgi:hypothetical protein